jgi:hypothetical protein
MGGSVAYRFRAVLCASVALVMVLTVLPTMQPSSSDSEKRSAETLANGSRTFNVGVIGFTGSVATLNPFVYTMSSEYEIIWPCCSTLPTYDIDAKEKGTADGFISWDLATVAVAASNSPPVISSVTMIPSSGIDAGTSVTFIADAADPEGDPLYYIWDLGDSTALQVGQITTHTFAKAGMFTFTVYVNDLTGIPGHNVSSSATASIAFSLQLVAGWNFISLPLAGYGYKASTLGLATGDMISQWNSTRQSFDRAYIEGISPPTADFAIESGVGYWVWVSTAKTLHICGSVPTTVQSREFTVPPGGGWIIVGFLGVTAVHHASDIRGMWNGTGTIMLVARFDPTTMHYLVWIAAVPTVNNFLLVPGVGYWCWVTSSGTLSYMPDHSHYVIL